MFTLHLTILNIIQQNVSFYSLKQIIDSKY